MLNAELQAYITVLTGLHNPSSRLGVGSGRAVRVWE